MERNILIEISEELNFLTQGNQEKQDKIMEKIHKIISFKENEIQDFKDKLHRRNVQIRELKKYYIGKLSTRELIDNAIRFLQNNGYKVTEITY